MRFRLSTAAVITALFVGACAGSTNPNQTAQAGGTVIIGVPNDASVSNPDISSDYPDSAIGTLVYQGMVTSRLDGGVDPALASSWDVSSDGLTFTFHLRTTNWTDGKPFTAADVVYTLTKVAPQYSAFFAGTSGSITSVTATDDHTVKIVLTKPYGPFLNALAADSGAAILPQHLFEGTDIAKNPASLQHPVGTGPFMMSEWVAGDHITLAKNPNYWAAGQPYLDKIIYQIIPSSTSMVLALQSGQVQYVDPDQIDQTNYAAIKSSGTLQLNADTFPASDDLMFFNVRGNRPTANVQVRHALAMAVDRNFLLKSLYSGVGDVGKEAIDTRLKWAVDSKVDYSTMYPFDAAKANSILDAAGFPKGSNGTRFSLNFVISSAHPPYVAAGQAMQQWFQAIGVKLNVVALDDQTATVRVFEKGNYDITIEGYTTRNDPALGIVREFTTSRIGKDFGNASGYSNPMVDQLALDGQSHSLNADRKPFYDQMQEIIANDLPVMLILQRTDFDASTKKLQGLWNGDEGYGAWWLATLQH
ncbi:MAG: ABC transporter substrate-binding protein [Candidatus Dormibacteraeota bacterium]|nr:ABC transporter substrate-binding protein [Candidatus Dormibacteraeota bacterium]